MGGTAAMLAAAALLAAWAVVSAREFPPRDGRTCVRILVPRPPPQSGKERRLRCAQDRRELVALAAYARHHRLDLE